MDQILKLDGKIGNFGLSVLMGALRIFTQRLDCRQAGAKTRGNRKEHGLRSNDRSKQVLAPSAKERRTLLQ